MTFRIQRQIDSATLTLPELQPLIGKMVEITISEQNHISITPGTGDWSALPAAADDLEGYDFDAWQRQRELDMQHSPGTLP